MEKFQEHFANFNAFMNESTWAAKLIVAILMLIIGWIAINLMCGIFRKVLRKRNFDETLTPFLVNLAKWLLRALLLVTTAAVVGIPTTSFVAILGGAALAIGLALQGTLGHFASGILLLTFRHVKVGHYIKIKGEEGTVKEIDVFKTILETFDGRTIFVPNGDMTNNILTNVTMKPERRLDLVFGIGYSDDIDKARSIIADIVAADERILDDPPPFIPLLNLGDSSVDLQLRAWVNTPDYWLTRFDIIEKVKKEFDSNGVSIPFPQRDIHMIPQKNT